MVISSLERPSSADLSSQYRLHVERALKALRARNEAYNRYEAYYVGKHPLTFASENYEERFARMVSRYTENYCPAVVDSVVDRLIITGFTDSEAADNEVIAEATADIWTSNRMDENALLTHQEAVKAGDSYIIVWPDVQNQNIVRMWPQDANCVYVHHDEETDIVDWAAKWWIDEDDKGHLTLYYPDRLVKFVTNNKVALTGGLGFAAKYDAFMPPEIEPHSYGQVPVFHFRNGGRIGGLGRSELADVLPVQDALNKSVADMLISMEFIAYPQRWATGVTVRLDPATGKPDSKAWQPGPDRIWTTGNAEASFGEFTAANLIQLLEVQNRFKESIADVSGTPVHYLRMSAEGDWPSGESLKTAEARFVSKIRRKQVSFGNTWEDVMTFALRVSRGAVLSSDSRLSAVWESASPRSETEAIAVSIGKQGLGVPNSQLQRELGYSQDEVDKFADEVEAEKELAVERQQKLFNSGTQPMPEGEEAA